jgi:hypothetical protein
MTMRRAITTVIAVLTLLASGIVTAPSAHAAEMYAGECFAGYEVDIPAPDFNTAHVYTFVPAGCFISPGPGNGTLLGATMLLDGWADPIQPGLTYNCARGLAVGTMDVTLRIAPLDKIIVIEDVELQFDYVAGTMNLTMLRHTPDEHIVAASQAEQVLPAQWCIDGSTVTRWAGPITFEIRLP